VTKALLDDHLLRDLLADDVGDDLHRVLGKHEPATTNLYLYRLSRSTATAPGGALTGSWSASRRRSLARQLVVLPDEIEVVPMRLLAFRMAEIAAVHRVSTLGAEAVAAAEHLGAPLCVWAGDDGPNIRAAMDTISGDYCTVTRS
jgi:hypothetical protein